MKKVKVDIPLEVLHDLVIRFNLTIDEAIDVAVKGTVDVIRDELKEQYEIYKNLKDSV